MLGCLRGSVGEWCDVDEPGVGPQEIPPACLIRGVSEVRELLRTKEILRKASVFRSGGSLNRRPK